MELLYNILLSKNKLHEMNMFKTFFYASEYIS